MRPVFAALMLLMSGVVETAVPAAAPAAAAELTRNDFAYSMPLQADGAAAVYEVELPLEVYRHAVSARLDDIRVLNAHGEVLPYTIVTSPAPSAANPTAATVPLFQLWGDRAQVAPGVNLNISTATTHLDLSSTAGAPTQRRRGYLLDTRSIRRPLLGVELEWPADANEFSELVSVQSSDDLAHWRDVAQAPLVNLRFNGRHLRQSRIDFPAAAAQFWRLMWPGEHEAVAALSARMFIASQAAPPPHRELRMDARPEAGKPGSFVVDLGAHLPVDRLNVQLPERNTLAQVTLQSRPRSADAWNTVASAVFFRLANGDRAELVNAALPIAQNRDRYWKIDVADTGGGIGHGTPALILAWVPETLRFVARGPGPYELVFGSAVARSAAAPLSALNAPSPEVGHPWQAVRAAAGPMREAGGPAKLLPPAPPKPWKTWILWGVLIAGVALLGWLALRLNRELSKGNGKQG